MAISSRSLMLLLVLASASFASDAVAAYVAGINSSNGAFCTGGNIPNCPYIRFWNSSGSGSWGPEIQLQSTGNLLFWVAVRKSPVSDKIILVSMNGNDGLDGYVCMANCTNANNWNHTGILTGRDHVPGRSFDLAFEGSTGNAVLVFEPSVANSSQAIGYITIPAAAASFSGLSPSYIPDPADNSSEYFWLTLASKPGASREMLLGAYDENPGSGSMTAWVWNGTSWSNRNRIINGFTQLGNTEGIAAAYTADGTQGMVAASLGQLGNGNISFTYWNGTVWSATSQFDTTPSNSNYPLWLTMKARPQPNGKNLQLASVDNNLQLTASFWNGTSWAVTSLIDTIDSSSTRVFDFDWLQNGTGYLVWDRDGAGTTLRTRACSPQCTASSTDVSTYAGTGAWLSLYSNPTSTDKAGILGLRLPSSGILGSFAYNGTFNNYGDSALTSNTHGAQTRSYSLSFLSASIPAAPPMVSLVSPANNSVLNSSTVTFTFNATDNSSSTLNCSIYKDSILNATNSSVSNGTLTSFVVPGVSPGSHSWNITCANPSGSAATSQTWSFTISSPSLLSLSLNATSPYNLTSDNLTCNYALNGSATTAAVSWYINGTPEMLLYLPFEGNSTNALLDYSGNGNNAANVNAAWSATGGYDGNGSFSFDGSGDCLTANHSSSLNITGPFTITTWFRRDASAAYQRLVAKSYTSNSAPYTMYGLLFDNANHLRMEVTSGGVQHALNGATTVTNGAWHFATAVYNGSVMSLYLDGSPDSSAALSGAVQTDTVNVSVGCSGYPGAFADFFNGFIDDVRIYNRPLSPQEIGALYQNMTNLVVSQETSIGDTWQCRVTPFSSSAAGATGASNNLTILNITPPGPSLLSLSLNATSPYNLTSDNLTCNYALNGSATTAAVSWYINGTPEMLLYLPFEGNSTNALLDYSGNGNNAANVNAAWSATGGYDGNGSFAFDGSTSYLDAGDLRISNDIFFTIMMWVKGPPQNDGHIFVEANLTSNPPLFQLGSNNSAGGQRLRIFRRNDSSTALVNAFSNANAFDNSWHHVAYVESNGSYQLYIDGVPDISGTFPKMAISVGTTALGATHRAANTFFFNGTLDDVRAYDRSLSAEEIKAIYQNMTNLVVSQETSIGDTWQCRVTPFSSSAAGPTSASNNLTIVTPPPNCPVITTAGAYTMSGNFVGAPNSASPLGGSACVKIASSNVVFDCGGFSITDNGTAGVTYGVLLNGSITNVTVRNCPAISLYRYGVFVHQSSGVSLDGITSFGNMGTNGADNVAGGGPGGNASGFFINGSANVNLTNSAAFNNTGGMGGNALILGLTGNGGDGAGAVVSGSSSIYLSNVTSLGNRGGGGGNTTLLGVSGGNGGSGYGIALFNSTGATITLAVAGSDSGGAAGSSGLLGGTPVPGTGFGFLATGGSSGNTLTLSTAYNNTNSGFNLTGGIGNRLSGDTSYNNSFSGFSLINCSRDNLSGNLAYGNALEGFSVSGSPNETLSGNTARGNLMDGFGFSQSANSSVSGNNATSNAISGLSLDGSSSGAFTSNYICQNTLDVKNLGASYSADGDRCDSFLNWSENGHYGCSYTCSSMWERFFGDVNGSIILGHDQAGPYAYRWNGTGFNIYFTQSNANVNWGSLQAIGRTASNASSSNDFTELDSAFNTSSFADSINHTYSSDGSAPLQTDNFTVFQRPIAFVPVANSTAFNTTFRTGILWDAADGGTEFSNAFNQTTVWVVKVSPDTPDVYGTYDYLAQVPYTLATYGGNSTTVSIYLELR